MVNPDSSKSSKDAWKNNRPHWFEGEKKAVSKLERDGYTILAWRGGYPDIMAEKDGKLSFFEIKRRSGALKDEQKVALLSLKKHGHSVHVWRYQPKTDDFIEGSII